MIYCDHCVMPNTNLVLILQKIKKVKISVQLASIIKIKKILIIKQDLKSLKPYAINTAE